MAKNRHNKEMTHRPFKQIKSKVDPVFKSRFAVSSLKRASLPRLLGIHAQIRRKLKRNDAWDVDGENFNTREFYELQQDFAWIEKLVQERMEANRKAFDKDKEYITPLYSECSWAPKSSNN